MNQISRSRIRRVVVSILLSAQGALAEQYSFTVWSVEDGLAQSQVSSVVQDCGGFLWAGTLGGGLSRFDGLEFRNYRTFDGLAHDTVRALLVDRRCRLWIGAGDALGRFDGRRFETVTRVGETIRTLMEDRRSRIWLGTESGLGWLDGRSFKRLALPEGLGSTVEAVIEDGAGRLWLGTADGIRILDGEGLALPVPPGAPHGAVHALAEDAAGNLWIGTDRGLLRYDGKTFSAQELPGEAAQVEAIFVASSGQVWLGTEGQGAYRYDGRRWTRFTEAAGLPSPTVWALAEDREEQIWLGTYRGGLVRFAGERFVHYTAADGLGDDVVRTILKDRRNQLVFGTFRGGVAFYDGSTFTRLTSADGLAHDFVLTALEDRRGDLWLGTFGGLSRWDGRQFENLPVDLVGDPVIRALLEDRNGSLWIGTNRGGVAIYDGESFRHRTTRDGLPSDAVMDLAEDLTGHVWIATAAGVARFDGATGLEDLSSRHPFLAGEVFSIFVDKRGELWFAVYGMGVLHYAPAAPAVERFETFTHADGLASLGVVSLVGEADGDLWIGTENGVYRLDMEAYRRRGEKRLTAYGRSEDFRGIECVHNAAGEDAQGRLWFGTLRGATRYDPAADVPSPAAPLVHITGIRLFLEERDLGPYARGETSASGRPEALELPHHQNHVTFDFTGIALRSPERLSYRVRLRGFDGDWIAVENQRHVTYSNLAPGSYVFEVAAENGDGVRSLEPPSFRLRITEPYWQRTWFRVTAVSALLGVLFLGHRWRLLSLRRREVELEEQVEARTELVEHQKDELARKNSELESFTFVVSHDLRSPLFTLKGFLKLLETDLAAGDAKRVERDLETLNQAADSMGELLSGLLKLSRAGQVIAKRVEVALAELAEEAVRIMGGALRERCVEVEISSSERLFCDRPRIVQVLQNLLENAVKFMGDEPRPSIRIGSRREGSETVFFVEDNGQGIDPADQEKAFDLFQRAGAGVEGAGVGLALVKKIIDTHGGRVWIESEGRGRGTRVLFTVPGPGGGRDG